MGSPRHCRALFLVVVAVLLTGLRPTRAADAPSEVTVAGTLSAKVITVGELLKFTISIQNRTKSPLISVRLQAPPDSYDFATIQGCGENPPPYYSSANAFSQARNILMPSVPPGATCTTSGYLKPTTEHPAATLIAVMEWTSPTGSSTSQTSTVAVTLGENAVESSWDATGRLLTEGIKILLVPAVLAGLGVGFNLAVQKRDRRRKELEEQGAARTETLKQMLQTSLDYAAKYYLPLSAAAERLVDALQPRNPQFDPKVPASGSRFLPPNQALVFYWMVYLEKRMDEQRKVIGGFYFKELSAERLASVCWKEYSEILFTKKADDVLSRATQACVNRLEARENYEAFAAKFKLVKHPSYGDSKAREAAVKLDERLANIDIARVVLLLNALQAIIDFEVNRPFEYWYDKPASLNMTTEIKNLLITKAGPQGLQFTQEEMKYFEQVRIVD